MEQARLEIIVRDAVHSVLQERSLSPCSQDVRIPVEVSARHVHLSKEDLNRLFGADALSAARSISQPGQFLSDCRVRVIGPKGMLDNVAVLGPIRGATQVELSATDARALGIKAPVRLSGDLADAAPIHLQAGPAMVEAKAAIVAMRHVHLTPRDAEALCVRDGQRLSVRVLGERPVTFEGVVARVSENSLTALHIDTDEANAAGVSTKSECRIVPCDSTPEAQASSYAKPRQEAPEPAHCGFQGQLLTEADAKRLIADGCKQLAVGRGQLVTALARDALSAAHVTLVWGNQP